MTYTINKLEIDEVQDYVKLFKKVFIEGFANYREEARDYIIKSWTAKKIRTKLAGDKYLFLVAKYNNRLVGYLIAKIYLGGVSSILWLGVLKKYRGQKIGSKLVLNWEKWAKKLGARKLRASTSNFSNEKFYRGLGYNKYPKIVKNDWGMDKLVFLKKINMST